MKRVILATALAVVALPAVAQNPVAWADGPLPVYAEPWCNSLDGNEQAQCFADEHAFRIVDEFRWRLASRQVRINCMQKIPPNKPYGAEPYPYGALDTCLVMEPDLLERVENEKKACDANHPRQ